jgi:transmembrane protein
MLNAVGCSSSNRILLAMPHAIEQFLRHLAVAAVARILLTFPFWGSGLAKLIDFQGGVAEMARFGLEPAVAFNIVTIIVQLGGALLIILNRYTWLGAGALGIFTALTIPIVHHFWSMTEEPFRTIAFHTATEHIGMIGALIVVSILAAHRSDSRTGPRR